MLDLLRFFEGRNRRYDFTELFVFIVVGSPQVLALLDLLLLDNSHIFLYHDVGIEGDHMTFHNRCLLLGRRGLVLQLFNFLHLLEVLLATDVASGESLSGLLLATAYLNVANLDMRPVLPVKQRFPVVIVLTEQQVLLVRGARHHRLHFCLL